MEKKMWNVYEYRDVDGGFGDAIPECNLVGTVMATDEEIEEFVKLWNKPRIYDHPYDSLCEHGIDVAEVEAVDIAGFVPYDPETRDWPDLPTGVSSSCKWDGKKWVKPSYIDEEEVE